jgi:transcriptional regulator with XRE-family HTH domain
VATTIDTTAELAAFLRTRRERLTPDAVGIPDSRRARRTPGLRREEVAELAGVSVDYVVRLEQGRGLRPSAEVLDALAGALRLEPDERAYLFDLAHHRTAHRSPRLETPGEVSPEAEEPLAQLVQDLSPLPAMLLNHRLDVLAWNAEMADLVVDFATLPPEHRNVLWICTLHPGMQKFYVDRERVIREGIADLRAAWAARPDDAGLAALVDELTTQDEVFAQMWALRDVRVNGRGHKSLLHPQVGPLTVEYQVLTPLQDPSQRLIFYRAVDSASQAALDTISAHS